MEHDGVVKGSFAFAEVDRYPFACDSGVGSTNRCYGITGTGAI